MSSYSPCSERPAQVHECCPQPTQHSCWPGTATATKPFYARPVPQGTACSLTFTLRQAVGQHTTPMCYGMWPGQGAGSCQHIDQQLPTLYDKSATFSACWVPNIHALPTAHRDLRHPMELASVAWTTNSRGVMKRAACTQWALPLSKHTWACYTENLQPLQPKTLAALAARKAVSVHRPLLSVMPAQYGRRLLYAPAAIQQLHTQLCGRAAPMRVHAHADSHMNVHAHRLACRQRRRCNTSAACAML